MDNKIVHAAPVPPFVTFVASAVPMVFDNSMSYYEALCALWKWLQDDVINVINNNATVTEEYIQLTKDMKEYMDNYFDNLDVQEEINNKLDAMVEDGTLQEIITTYIQANVAWTFDTVADMKASENLINGSYAQTLGFYTLNDEGGGIYKISDSGTANEMDVIAVGDLYAQLVNAKNIKQFGAHGDGNTDDADIINRALTIVPDCKVPAGTYKVNTSVVVPASHSLTGTSKEASKLLYFGSSSCVVLDGRYSKVSDLTIEADESVSSNSKIGVAVRPDIAPSAATTITNVEVNNLVIRKFYKGVSLDNMWQATISNCIIAGATKGSSGNRICYGISYESSGTVLAHWSGSGNVVENCYITNCSYGFNLLGTWDVTVINCIIEGNYSSMNKDAYGKNTIFVNCWFEANEAPAALASPIIMIGGRYNLLTDGVTQEFPRTMNNVYFIDQDGTSFNRYSQRISSNEPQSEVTLAGVKSLIPADGSKTKIATMKAFTSRGNVVNQTTQEVSDNNLTGEISLNTYGTAGGNGKTYTTFEFSSGQTNGNAVDIAIRPVFEVDKSGNIKCPDSTETVDVGTQDHVYRRGWFKWLTLKSSNGNYYNLSIDNSGNITATQV